MSAPIVHKTVFTSGNPIVVYFPKMAPPSLLAMYIESLVPGHIPYVWKDSKLLPLATFKGSWVNETLYTLPAGTKVPPNPSPEYVIKTEDREPGKARYEAWKTSGGRRMHTLENPDDNTSIVSVKDTVLHFSTNLENVKEFEKSWNVKSVSDDSAHMKRALKRDVLMHILKNQTVLNTIETGFLCITLSYIQDKTSGVKRIMAKIKSDKLYESLQKSTLLSPIAQAFPEVKILLLDVAPGPPVLLKDIPKSSLILKYVKNLLNRMYAEKIEFTSSEVLKYIALDTDKDQLYLILPAFVTPMTPAASTKKLYVHKMLQILLK